MAAFRTGFLTLSTLTLFAAPALAGPPPPPAPNVSPPQHHQHPASSKLTLAKLEPPAHRAQGVQRSVGSPTEGHLINGSHLAEAPYLRVVPVYVPGDARWGVEPLVALIDHSARNVRKQFPDSVLSVGHLSRPGGGEIDRHASHESGRDADIGFYVRNQTGKPIYAEHFVAFKGDGTAPSWPGAQFDDPRNWALVSSMVSDPHAHITHIFVATPIRTRLLQYAEKVGAPLATRVRASELMAQPHGSLPHDDHFHVRVGCPAGMDKCIEQPLARKHRPGVNNNAATTASLSHTHDPRASSLSAPTMRAPSHPAPAAAHTHPAAKPATAPAPAESKDESESTNKSEAYVPSLAPMVPGLDSAVIPAPITGLKPAAPPPPSPSSDKPTPPPPAAIDDPDGVLEKN